MTKTTKIKNILEHTESGLDDDQLKVVKRRFRGMTVLYNSSEVQLANLRQGTSPIGEVIPDSVQVKALIPLEDQQAIAALVAQDGNSQGYYLRSAIKMYLLNLPDSRYCPSALGDHFEGKISGKVSAADRDALLNIDGQSIGHHIRAAIAFYLDESDTDTRASQSQGQS
jgi:predicted DNA-binding protein